MKDFPGRQDAGAFHVGSQEIQIAIQVGSNEKNHDTCSQGKYIVIIPVLYLKIVIKNHGKGKEDHSHRKMQGIRVYGIMLQTQHKGIDQISQAADNA